MFACPGLGKYRDGNILFLESAHDCQGRDPEEVVWFVNYDESVMQTVLRILFQPSIFPSIEIGLRNFKTNVFCF